jgi:hypothetical protein
MTLAVGFSTMILPHQVPPLMVGMQLAKLGYGRVLVLSLPLAGIGLVALLPLQYGWWRIIGAFG